MMYNMDGYFLYYKNKHHPQHGIITLADRKERECLKNYYNIKYNRNFIYYVLQFMSEKEPLFKKYYYYYINK